MGLVCQNILGFDLFYYHLGTRGHQPPDTHAEHSGCLPVLNCLMPGTDMEGTLEEGTGTTKPADAHGEKRHKDTTGPQQEYSKNREEIDANTTKTMNQLLPQIVLAYEDETSCHFGHAFCHGSILIRLPQVSWSCFGLRRLQQAWLLRWRR